MKSRHFPKAIATHTTLQLRISPYNHASTLFPLTSRPWTPIISRGGPHGIVTGPQEDPHAFVTK